MEQCKVNACIFKKIFSRNGSEEEIHPGGKGVAQVNIPALPSKDEAVRLVAPCPGGTNEGNFILAIYIFQKGGRKKL